VWMLTGDKGTTAQSIAKNCGLIGSEMKIYEIDAYKFESDLDKLYGEVNTTVHHDTHAVHPSEQDCALVLSGSTLEKIMDSSRSQKIKFAEIIQNVRVVVEYRCSPTHKGQTVEFIKTNPLFGNPVTMAVGDGANDVCMI